MLTAEKSFSSKRKKFELIDEEILTLNHEPNFEHK